MSTSYNYEQYGQLGNFACAEAGLANPSGPFLITMDPLGGTAYQGRIVRIDTLGTVFPRICVPRENNEKMKSRGC